MEHPEYQDLEIQGCRLVMTCGACPEQYDVYRNDFQIGYLRLRHGNFMAEYGNCGGTPVYESETVGDGIFQDSEREKHLFAAVAALVAHHRKDWVEGQPSIHDVQLRDLFAAHALQGILSGGFADTVPHDDVGGGSDAAHYAYQYADAMLAERK